jgi:hypothetical protein
MTLEINIDKDQEKEVLTMAPITKRIKISEVQARLFAQLNVCHRPRNLPRHEGPSPTRTLVVEQDTVAGVHPVRFTVVDTDPIRVELGAAVGGSGVEGRGLTLRGLDNFAVEFRSGGLVEADVFLQAAGSDGVEETQGAETIDIASVFRHLEGDLDVGLGSEVVDFGGLDLGDDVDEVGAVAEVAVVQLELVGAWITRFREPSFMAGRVPGSYVHAGLRRGGADDQC